MRQGPHDPRGVRSATTLLVRFWEACRLPCPVFTCPVHPPYPPLLLHYPVWGPQLALLSSKVPVPSEVPDREHIMNKFPFSFLKLWFNVYSGLCTLLGQNLGPEGVEGT